MWQDKPQHILAHEELVAVEKDARDVAQDEDKDNADEDKRQIDLDQKDDDVEVNDQKENQKKKKKSAMKKSRLTSFLAEFLERTCENLPFGVQESAGHKYEDVSVISNLSKIYWNNLS